MILEIEYDQALEGIDPVLAEVKRKRVEQLEKWGAQDHKPEMWLGILVEEVGEVAKEIAETQFKRLDGAAYREELLHVAAVASAAVQCLDDGIA